MPRDGIRSGWKKSERRPSPSWPRASAPWPSLRPNGMPLSRPPSRRPSSRWPTHAESWAHSRRPARPRDRSGLRWSGPWPREPPSWRRLAASWSTPNGGQSRISSAHPPLPWSMPRPRPPLSWPARPIARRSRRSWLGRKPSTRLEWRPMRLMGLAVSPTSRQLPPGQPWPPCAVAWLERWPARPTRKRAGSPGRHGGSAGVESTAACR